MDLTLTEELKEEGYARDIVRNIQDVRKQMGCEITDYIHVSFKEGVPLKWSDYICKETLGKITEIENPDSIIEVELEDGKKAIILISLQ